ncbi:tail assembly chaperone [Vagococcus silagei]|uniref:Phage tail protein n=1 Tax=Vagococcus silagei TaxID=2508885 RepID=A0A4S3B6X2_9ENTE|nr:tail assembly chaperone [Vagococcus silagei]THB62177.1 hypothetical protein ESZ54_01150 [Vagococcus silagei]
MELTINKKMYQFKFGVKFIRTLDEEMPIVTEQGNFGLSLSAKVIPELQSGNTNTLARVLSFANYNQTPRASLNDLDDYIDDCENIEELFDMTLKAIETSNSGKLAMTKFNQAIAKAEKSKKK